MLNPKQAKEEVNNIIVAGINEILAYKLGRVIEPSDIEAIRVDLNYMLKAMRFKNKIYDYACSIGWDDLFQKYVGKIAYSLVNTENMHEEDKNKYEDLIQFSF